MLELFQCGNCGKIVLVTQDGKGTLVCCGQPMVEAPEKTTDEGKEKHAPVIETVRDGIRVKVGAVPHPMEPDHHIRWIEVMGDTFFITKTLKAGDAPAAEFQVDPHQVQKVRIFCNKHGFWKAP